MVRVAPFLPAAIPAVCKLRRANAQRRRGRRRRGAGGTRPGRAADRDARHGAQSVLLPWAALPAGADLRGAHHRRICRLGARLRAAGNRAAALVRIPRHHRRHQCDGRVAGRNTVAPQLPRESPHRAARRARCAHRDEEPSRVRRTTHTPVAAGGRRPASARDPADRRGSLQGLQRPLRAPGWRRRPAAGCQRRAGADPQAARPAVPLRGRRIRGAAVRRRWPAVATSPSGSDSP